MFEPSLSKGFRKGSVSIYPVVGKLSSNITMSLISSVSKSLWRMVSFFVEKDSFATLSAAYSVSQRSEMIFLILSNPSFSSSLVSVVISRSPLPFSELHQPDATGSGATSTH